MFTKFKRVVPALILVFVMLNLCIMPAAAQQREHDGDVNQDGALTPVDALLAFQHFLELVVLEAAQQVRANVFDPDNSGITPADGQCIFQQFLGLSSCLDLSLLIATPSPGSFILENQPDIELTYSATSGVDTSSLAFTANGAPLAVNCQLEATGGVCTPTTPLPDGLITLGASIADDGGQAVTTQLVFTVNTTPASISIDAPSDGLITKDAEVQVTGTAGAAVTNVTVNGINAALSEGAFSATVPLREGTNMVVAVGTEGGGRTGTDTIEVTQDIFAPIVRIDSPRDGFVSANATIAITGLVNDVVNGATNPRVLVNGVEATVGDGAFLVTDLPLVRGANTVLAVATDAVGNEGRHQITVTFQPPVGARMSVASGNGQAAPVRQALSEALVVNVRDSLGNPMAGRVVRFEVTRNNGTLTTGSTTPQRVLEVPTDSGGQASVQLTLGDTAGEGNNRVRAASAGVTGEVEFCATGQSTAPDKILMAMGDNQRGVVGNPLATPFEALVIDRDGNPIQGVAATFTVVKGGGNLNGGPTLVRTSGTDGKVRAVLTLGPKPGINNNVVNVAFAGLTGLPATFVASGLVPGDPAQTRLSGVVLDNAQTPIPEAVVSIGGSPTISDTTDVQGQFLLENVPVGHIELKIDPTNSPRPETFPPLAFEMVTVAGQINNLGQPIMLPAVQTQSSRIVGGTEDVTLSMPGVAGLELTVFANSVTFPNGDRTGQLTISQVHLDKVPMPPPNGTVFMPPAWTIQPAGVHFDPPARISIPNDGLPPGRVIDIFQFDHTLNQFINVGKGTVSEDGLVIVSDPGFGITRAGWGGCGQPQPPTTCASSCDDGNRCTTDSCVNGSCVHTPITTPQTAANMCEGCNNGREIPKKTNAQCCADISHSYGYVLCCNGSKITCVGNDFPPGTPAQNIIRQCVFAHERAHFSDVDCPTGANECTTNQPPFKAGRSQADGECDATKAEVACLRAASCPGTGAAKTACEAGVAAGIVDAQNYGNGFPGCNVP